MDVTGARVNVSGPMELYPGTSDRVVLVSGNEAAVSAAQSLIWVMFAQTIKAAESGNNRGVSWSPRLASETSREYFDIHVEGKITIPASGGGLILGRGGLTIKSISEDSNAHIQMTGKDDALFTQERVISIGGTVGSCARASSVIISKLAEDDSVQFVNRGTSYTSQAVQNVFASHSGEFFAGQKPRGQPRQAAGMLDASGAMLPDSINANTTITLTVPDSLVGNILGKHGTTMREIMSLSGAKINVSTRGEFAESNANRIVTITGTPASAQTAHLFVSQKLQQASSATRKPRTTKRI